MSSITPFTAECDTTAYLRGTLLCKWFCSGSEWKRSHMFHCVKLARWKWTNFDALSQKKKPKRKKKIDPKPTQVLAIEFFALSSQRTVVIFLYCFATRYALFVFFLLLKMFILFMRAYFYSGTHHNALRYVSYSTLLELKQTRLWIRVVCLACENASVFLSYRIETNIESQLSKWCESHTDKTAAT